MDRRQVLIAYGVAEYAAAVEHLAALRTAGVHVSTTTMMRLRNDWHTLCQTWVRDYDPDHTGVIDLDQVTTQAKVWVNAEPGRIATLDSILEEAGMQ